jgi:hypothetical protein
VEATVIQFAIDQIAVQTVLDHQLDFPLPCKLDAYRFSFGLCRIMAKLAARPFFADDPVLCCLPRHKNAADFGHPRLDDRTLFGSSIIVAAGRFVVAATAAVEHERHQPASD